MVIGLVTNVGLNESIIAAGNQGWYIFPTTFQLSESKGTLTSDRTGLVTPFYEAPISSRIVKDVNNIEFVCTIPAGAVDIDGVPIATSKSIQEVGLFSLNMSSDLFLLAVGQPNPIINYNPDGSLSFRLLVNVQNLNIASLYQFFYTQAAEITEHNANPAAHPELLSAIKKAGIFVNPNELAAFKYRGQLFDEFPTFDATVATDMMVYRAADGEYNPALADGTIKERVAGIAIDSQPVSCTFDSGTDLVTANNHGLANGTALKFTITLGPITAGVTYYVRDAATNTYALATTLGGDAINLTVSGGNFYFLECKHVVTAGFVQVAAATVSGFNAGDNLYLSTATPGLITNVSSDIYIGKFLGLITINGVSYGLILLGSSGGLGYNKAQEEGVNLTTRRIINFIGSGITATDDSGNARTNITLNQKLNDIVDATPPGADRIWFWDESASKFDYLIIGANLAIVDKILSATGGGGSGASYTTDFDNGDLTTGILTVNHALGKTYVTVTVYDNNGHVVMPDDIISVDTLNVQIDLTTFGTLTGTWNVVITA